MSIFSFATNSKIKFLSLRKPAFILSLVLIICSILIYSYKGLNFGINDFGKSAPDKKIYDHCKLNSESIVKKIKEKL